jgi:hypothetical protein
MQARKLWRPAALAGLALTVLLPLGLTSASERVLNATLEEQKVSDRDAARSQARIAQLSDQTTELLGEYRLVLQRLEQVRLYNANLQQLDDFQVVKVEIVPLMFSMIEDLENLIALDVPFLLEERTDRVTRLKDMMDSSNVAIGEKYRQIMEAYKVEVDYGRTIEAYSGNLERDGQTREVDFLRVGRIVLAYQTIDKAETGFWNKQTGQWETLGAEYRTPITEGLRIARKQSAPNLLKLPVPAPVPAESS